MDRRRAQQGGSIMIIVAVAMLVLIAFVGLVVDGGEITSQVRISQNAADSAALAAAWQWADNGQSITSSKAIASVVAVKNGIPVSDLTLSFKDINHNNTTIASEVQYIDADVTHNFPTLFLPIINIDSASTVAHAEVQVVGDPYDCVVCSMSPNAAGALTIGSTFTVTGGTTTVNSSSATALTVTGSFTDTAGINVVGGVSGAANVSPSPTTGVAQQPDPLANVPQPTLSAYASCPVHAAISGTGPWPAGIYAGASASGSTDIKLDGALAGWCGMKGVFVFTGNISMGGNSTLSTVNGAMIYLTCGTFPTSYCGGATNQTGACPNAGAAGATLSEGGSSTIQYSASPGYGGPYAGMAIMADRCNKPPAGTNLVDFSGNGHSGDSSLSGTIYAPGGTVSFSGNETWTLSSRIVADKLDMGISATDAFSVAANYTPQTKLLLVQ